MSALWKGYKWAVLADIKDCFGSFEPERVADILPLPRRVTRNVILGANLRVIPGRQLIQEEETTTMPLTMVSGVVEGSRRGLPQGSMASSLVAEMLLSDIELGPCAKVEAVFYADNILCFARTEREARAIQDPLRAIYGWNRAGPFELHKEQIGRISRGFEFLGYRFYTRYGRPHIEPSGRSRELMTIFLRVCFASGRHLDGLERRIEGWYSSFRLAPDAALWRTFMLQALEATRERVARGVG